LRKLLARLGDPPVSIVLWDGSRVATGYGRDAATLWIRSRFALYRMLSRPSLQFGECYRDGSIEVEGDLVALLETAWRSIPAKASVTQRLAAALRRVTLANGHKRARKNARAHYDLGTDFFGKWLDSSMVYTCAYFERDDAALEDAQRAKLDRVCRKLALRPNETVIEAGCGWGSLALYMAEHYGVRVTAFNVSTDQIAYAREQARRRGLSERVQFVEDDYRNIVGRYDAFVAVGMLEHVGVGGYRELGALIHRCLEAGGRGLLHSIGRDRPHATNPWIRRRIFPGGYTPSLREMLAVFEPNALSVLDVENLRTHYARTLDHWLERFEANAEALAREFGETFIRSWRLYLASADAAFRSGWLQLFQIVFCTAGGRGVRWQRLAGPGIS